MPARATHPRSTTATPFYLIRELRPPGYRADRLAWPHGEGDDEDADEDAEDDHTTAGCRSVRPHPRARRTVQQPQGRQRRAAQAPTDRIHRRLRLGQEFAGLRYDRRRVAAAHQRDV